MGAVLCYSFGVGDCDFFIIWRPMFFFSFLLCESRQSRFRIFSLLVLFLDFPPLGLVRFLEFFSAVWPLSLSFDIFGILSADKEVAVPSRPRDISTPFSPP